MKKDLLSIDDLSGDEIHLVLDTAEALREIGQAADQESADAARKTIVICSTSRARAHATSFEIARSGWRRHAERRRRQLELLKGETLADTAMNIDGEGARHDRAAHASFPARGHLLSRI